MELIFEQECPQCGGTVELAESEHLLPCPFCGTRSFIVPKGFPRFVLPPRTEAENIVYAPYLRFKGVVYDCNDSQVSYKILDLTSRGVALDFLPDSLGVRAQALKMKFASPDHNGRFLKLGIDIKEAVEQRAGLRAPGSRARKIFHRAYIGESISIVYFPFIINEDKLLDGITGDFIAELPPEDDIFEPFLDQKVGWKPRFVTTLCPACGWDLEGDRRSVVLGCRNCGTFWEATGEGFRKVAHSTVHPPDIDSVYLAFWQISVKAEGIRLDSFADFLESTSQPRLPEAGDDELPMSFLVPAFKIKPKTFLRLGSQLTIGQKIFVTTDDYPELPLHRIDLPQTEAVQSLKPIFASAAANRKELLPRLPEIKLKVIDSRLLLLPFSNSDYGHFQEQAKINLNKQDLKHGEYL
ncbi:hypothetical protein KAR10_06540 [bacterium]|nr:hypothetical protein [bacterium]